jgi:amino acid transporter
MKLNIKLFRPRVSIWEGFGGAILFSVLTIKLLQGELTEGSKTINYTAIILVSLLSFAFVVCFSIVGLVALRTYRNQYMSFDKARWKEKVSNLNWIYWAIGLEIKTGYC